MFEGRLVGIYLAAKTGAPVTSVARVKAVAGRGLEGDRNYADPAASAEPPKPDQQVTLIEAEAVEAVARETGKPLAHGDPRRNLVTRDVPLNHLVGREFLVGSVRLRGHRLCEPCGYLEEMCRSGLKQDLLHRGGLRAEILSGGVLEPGQPIRPA
jgi:MOSC domain-containing protein YiiM